jgi:hypothetical protein
MRTPSSFPTAKFILVAAGLFVCEGALLLLLLTFLPEDPYDYILFNDQFFVWMIAVNIGLLTYIAWRMSRSIK